MDTPNDEDQLPSTIVQVCEFLTDDLALWLRQILGQEVVMDTSDEKNQLPSFMTHECEATNLGVGNVR